MSDILASDIDAGGGAVIDLIDEGDEIVEVKTLADNTQLTVAIDRGDFDPSIYGLPDDFLEARK